MDPQSSAPEPRLVHVDGRAIPVRDWERELTLRCAAWIAIVQAVIVSASHWWGIRYYPHMIVWWKIGLCAALTGVGLAVVRARPLRIALAGVLLVSLAALLMIMSAFRGSFTSSDWSRSLPYLLPCCAYLAGGILLLRRRAIGRDLLLVLTFAWLATVVPPSCRWVYMHSAHPHDHDYGWSDQDTDILDVLVAVAPPIFVLATVLSGPGRSLLPAPTESARLAPLASLLRGGLSLQAWGAVAVLLATLVGTLHRADGLSQWFDSPW